MSDVNKWSKHRQVAEHAVSRANTLGHDSLVDSVAAAIDCITHDEVAAERERCAKLVEGFATDQPGIGVSYWGKVLAKAIREGK